MKKVLKYKVVSKPGVMPIEVVITEQSHREDCFGNNFDGFRWIFGIKNIKYYHLSSCISPGMGIYDGAIFVRGSKSKLDKDKIEFSKNREFNAFEKLVKAYNEYEF